MGKKNSLEFFFFFLLYLFLKCHHSCYNKAYTLFIQKEIHFQKKNLFNKLCFKIVEQSSLLSKAMNKVIKLTFKVRQVVEKTS